MNEKALTELLLTIGRRVDSNADWAAVAMACIDQAMIPVTVQNEIEKIIDNALAGMPDR